MCPGVFQVPQYVLLFQEQEQRKAAIIKNFGVRSQNLDLKKQRLRNVMDFEVRTSQCNHELR